MFLLPEFYFAAFSSVIEVGERRLTGHFITVFKMMKGAQISNDKLSFSMRFLERRSKIALINSRGI